MEGEDMELLSKCSILNGFVSPEGKAFITLMNDALAAERRQHAIPLYLSDGGWSPVQEEPVLPWLAAGIASTDQQAVIVGWGGQVLVLKGNECRKEALARKDSMPVSIVRSVVAIGNAVYAAGLRRQVYTRAPAGWMAIDAGVVCQGNDNQAGFEVLGGFGDKEIYGAGLNGEIWRCDNGAWSEIQSPTNVHLHSLCCANDDVYIGGRNGLLVIGRDERWALHDTGLDETIWDLHWFDNRLLLLTSSGIYTYQDDTTQKVQSEVTADGDFFRFSSTPHELWVFGRKEIVRFDGKQWHRQATEFHTGASSSPATAYLNGDPAIFEEGDPE
jgi:hypothetical protein